jgi:hypothetical protein
VRERIPEDGMPERNRARDTTRRAIGQARASVLRARRSVVLADPTRHIVATSAFALGSGSGQAMRVARLMLRLRGSTRYAKHERDRVEEAELVMISPVTVHSG